MKFFALVVAFFAFFNLSYACLHFWGNIDGRNVANAVIYDNDALVCWWNNFSYTWDTGNAQWMNCINDVYAWVDLSGKGLHYAAHGDDFSIPMDSWWDSNNWSTYYFDAKAFCP
jgi:hypothetical protein